MTRKQKRLLFIGAIGAVLMAAVLLVMTALRDEIVFFYTPSDILVDGKASSGQRIRLGGLVKEASIVKNGENVTFVVTDNDREIPVSYTGILPDLFREGQGVVAEGIVGSDGSFAADTVLAKHDENYMPKEVADALKEKGVWQEGADTVKK
ncbi:MAG: cytochrome c maturation protein CcmE [Nitratireductor sp.]|nr:cytochrome c maturation protein CcmE [Nitratireductor sp.]MCB1454993.1 cytochrome c maturation protein CcmE [Nitratireductor sp.]